MPTVTNKALESAYGFKSTGFTVDALGNITARSLVETQGSERIFGHQAERVQTSQCTEESLI